MFQRNVLILYLAVAHCNPENGSDSYLQNAGYCLQDCRVSQATRQQSTFPQIFEAQISFLPMFDLYCMVIGDLNPPQYGAAGQTLTLALTHG